MNQNEHFSAEHLNAFIDGELDYEDSARLLDAMAEDAVLSRRIERLREVKLAVGRHYAPRAAIAALAGSTLARVGARWRHAVAAGLILALGAGLGYGVRGVGTPAVIEQASMAELDAQQGNLLLHVSDANARDFAAMLDRIESLYADAARQGLQVEVVANASGLDMLRSDASPFAERIGRMMDRYPDLHFVACTNAINRYRERGTTVHLIRNTIDDMTAIERIVMRIGQGWTYVAI